MKQTFALTGLIVILSGCSTVTDLPRGYNLDSKDAEGLSVASLTLSGINLDEVSSFEYRVREVVSDATAEAIRKPYFRSATRHARWLQDKDAPGPTAGKLDVIVKDPALPEPLDVVESGKAIGRLVVLRLPPGNYELYDWTLVVSNQYGGNVFSSSKALGYRFKIDAGRVTYLGNVDLRMSEQDRYKVTVNNRATRDIDLLRKKLPFLQANDIIYRAAE